MDKTQINLIFDCDGTLIDSYDAITERIVRAFRTMGFKPDAKEIRRRALYSDTKTAVKQTFEQFGEKADMEKWKAIYDTITENEELIRIYEGVENVVSNSRFNCFIYTHRGASCAKLMEKFGIGHNFKEIVDSTYGFLRKPSGEAIEFLLEKHHLQREKTYYVGDRMLDIECGRNSHIKTIFFNCAKLNIDASKADFVIEEFEQINHLPL